jgi:hypothetical protein
VAAAAISGQLQLGAPRDGGYQSPSP